MATLTSTELGASGRFIRFTAAAFNNLGSQTIMSRCRPTGSGGGTFGYIYGKVASGTIAGPRFFIEHNSGNPLVTFGFSSSGVSGKPTRQATAGSITYNAWQDIAGTWDGSLISSGINLYVDGTAVNPAYSSLNNGTGTISDDSANPAVLMNREGLGREFVGDVAWIAVWDRVLNSTERALASSDGPLEVPDGLVLLWANQADLGPNGLTPHSRSTYVAGSLPTNTALGGTAAATEGPLHGTVSDAVAALSGSSLAEGALAGTVSDAEASITGSVPAITLREDYERSSVNLAGSSVSGVGDAAVISIKPRMQETEAVPSNPRWLEPSVRVDNVVSIRPSFKFTDYAATAAANKYHGAPWQTTRRPMFSYDRLTWHYFDAQTVTASEIQFRHNTAFTGNTVYIGRGRQVSVTQVGEWLEGIAAAHPTKIAPAASAAAFTPTLTSWPAQAYIAGEFATQTDELGRTIPRTPFYAFEIDDTGLGSTKRLAVMTAGVHAGEDLSDVAFQRATEYLLGSSAEAVALRTHYRILVYPMMNAPGRAGGGWRGSFTQGTGGADDANRNFTAINGLEIVSLPRAKITADLASEVPDWHIDWHGQFSGDYGLFVERTIDNTFRTRLTTQSGETVNDMGGMSHDSVSNYFADLGSVLAVTLEHGDQTQQSDADLASWGGAVVRTLESMRADGLFYATASGTLDATTSDATAALTSGTVVSGTITALLSDATASITSGTAVSGAVTATTSDATATLTAGGVTAGVLSATTSDSEATLTAGETYSGALHSGTSDVIAILSGYITITGSVHAAVSDSIAAITGALVASGEINGNVSSCIARLNAAHSPSAHASRSPDVFVLTRQQELFAMLR